MSAGGDKKHGRSLNADGSACSCSAPEAALLSIDEAVPLGPTDTGKLQDKVPVTGLWCMLLKPAVKDCGFASVLQKKQCCGTVCRMISLMLTKMVFHIVTAAK